MRSYILVIQNSPACSLDSRSREIPLIGTEVRDADTVYIVATHNYGFMLIFMKTTIELPDELLIAAKKKAAELRKPLRALIEAGLREQLTSYSDGTKRTKPRKINWVTVDGGLPEGLDIQSRGTMVEWLQKSQ